MIAARLAQPVEFASGPSNPEAEQELLGILLFDPEALYRVEGLVRAEAFHDGVHGAIFGAIEDSVRKGRAPAPSILQERLKAHPAFEEYGGVRFLADLLDRAPPSAMAPDLARAIANAWTRRELARVLGEATSRATAEGEADGLELVADTERQLAEIANAGPARDEWQSAGAVVASAISEARSRSSRIEFPTGLSELDSLLGGFNPGEVAIIAGRPGMAKSTVALAIAKANARQGKGTSFFSQEMGTGPLGLRLACDVAYDRSATIYSAAPGLGGNPTYDAARKNELSPTHWARLDEAKQQIDGWPLLLDVRPGLTVSTMEAAARRAHRRWARQGIQPGPVIVDHLGIVRPEKDRKGAKHAEVADVSRALSVMAKSLGVPVVVLCQLNRGVEGREDKRPVMSDLRQAGEIEEDARQIVFLLRPEYYFRPPLDKGSESYEERIERETQLAKVRNKLLFLVEKNSNGPVGQVEAFCDVACSAVRDREAS